MSWRNAADGRVRNVGVSDFQIADLEGEAKESGTVPAVNPIEAHPYFTTTAAASKQECFSAVGIVVDGRRGVVDLRIAR
jgi:diketogulonate reductase-like aldo/keto reductase